MTPELTDVLKGDLAKIWNNHLPDLDPCYSSPANTSSVSIGDDDMDDDVYYFIVRLYSFFTNILKLNSTKKTLKKIRTRDTLHRLLFQKHDTNQNDWIPRLHLSRQVLIPIDYPSFQSEFEMYNQEHFPPSPANYTHTNYSISNRHLTSFAAYLHHQPKKAIAALECAVAITMTSLFRSYHNNQSNHNNSSPFLSTHYQQQLHQAASTVHFIARLYNYSHINTTTLSSLHINIPLSEIKTNLVHKFVSIQGQVIKVQPKRLRVTSSEFTCNKCSSTFRHIFRDGKYNVPTKCQNKCRSKQFVLLRCTATYIDYQEVKIQETQDDYVNDFNAFHTQSSSNTPSKSSSTSAGGRTPKTLEIQISGKDMVDTCRAGDVICVVGIVKAMNTAIKSGRRGRGALETSTYQLFLKANSISVLGNSIYNTTNDHNDPTSNPSSMEDETNPNKSKKENQHSKNTTNHISFTRDQLKKITKLAHADPKMGPITVRMAFPFDLLVRSLCPDIIGHDLVKAGILLALLGGTGTSSSSTNASGANNWRMNPTTIRTNAHILIVGDPGMGKSQMLLAATQIAFRSVYVGGNTTSSTGLTVSLTKEKGGDVGIEAGALVLADRGVCCIDEFDKMSKTNQDGLLEAMEQQQISIAKAGIVASLPSRCSVIAAANPKNGSYDMNRSVAENLNMNTPLLSRFDLVFILRDGSSRVDDGLITINIMDLYRNKNAFDNNNERNRNDSKRQKTNMASYLDDDHNDKWVPLEIRFNWVNSFQKAPLPASLIKDYILYAKQYCFPKLTKNAAEVLQDYFLSLRSARAGSDSVPITTRQLEALIRLSQARAKACLREFVIREDALDVVDLMKHSVDQVHTDEYGKIDKSRGGAGGRSKRREKQDYLNGLKEYKERTRNNNFSWDDLLKVAKSTNVSLSGFRDMIDDLRHEGSLIFTHNQTYQLAS